MPRASSKKTTKKTTKTVAAQDPRFPSRPRNFRVGNDVLPTRDMGRMVRWPRYVRVQRQRKVLTQRLKVPPAINQFNGALDKSEAAAFFKLFAKYAPETRAEKKQRLLAQAEAKAAGGDGASTGSKTLKFGMNHVTKLIESKKAKLVAIASDVDPIELVVWLPALCRKMDVPYIIVKNRGRLGTLVHQKKATCVALTDINAEDNATMERLTELARAKFNNNTDAFRKWGGGIMGLKTQAKLEKRERALKEEAAKKALL
jgi:large subunit ribosomal protein L7Ae